MQSESIDVRWLDRFQQVSIDDLVALSGLGEASYMSWSSWAHWHLWTTAESPGVSARIASLPCEKLAACGMTLSLMPTRWRWQ